eukprot:351737-Chlamydomonas_euryale.AAC.14
MGPLVVAVALAFLETRVALNGERYPPFTVQPVTGRRRGRRRPAAPTRVDLSHGLVEPPTRPKTQAHQEHYRCRDASDRGHASIPRPVLPPPLTPAPKVLRTLTATHPTRRRTQNGRSNQTAKQTTDIDSHAPNATSCTQQPVKPDIATDNRHRQPRTRRDVAHTQVNHAVKRIGAPRRLGIQQQRAVRRPRHTRRPCQQQRQQLSRSDGCLPPGQPSRPRQQRLCAAVAAAAWVVADVAAAAAGNAT